MNIDTLITMRDWKVRISTPDKCMTYHQNDTVIIIMNGKTGIVDKQAFRDMLKSAELDENKLASHLLHSVLEAN